MKFLVVDDSLNDVALLRSAFPPSECIEITPVESGQTALQLLSKQEDLSFDLVIIDWRLPGVPGDQVAQAFLAAPRIHSQIPVVVLSSALPPLVSDKLHEHGAFVWEKPLDLDGYERLAINLCELARRSKVSSILSTT
jgi:CheY-like chemotaxis protein